MKNVTGSLAIADECSYLVRRWCDTKKWSKPVSDYNYRLNIKHLVRKCNHANPRGTLCDRMRKLGGWK